MQPSWALYEFGATLIKHFSQLNKKKMDDKHQNHKDKSQSYYQQKDIKYWSVEFWCHKMQQCKIVQPKQVHLSVALDKTFPSRMFIFRGKKVILVKLDWIILSIVLQVIHPIHGQIINNYERQTLMHPAVWTTTHHYYDKQYCHLTSSNDKKAILLTKLKHCITF